MRYIVNSYVAQTYGTCAYGSSGYQDGSCTTGTSTTSATTSGSSDSDTSGGMLTNTGFDIVLAVTIACTIIFIALLVRFWRRPASKSRAGSQ